MGMEWVGYLDHVTNMGNEFTVFVLNPEALDMTDRLTPWGRVLLERLEHRWDIMLLWTLKKQDMET
jgi:hypothetical protein